MQRRILASDDDGDGGGLLGSGTGLRASVPWDLHSPTASISTLVESTSARAARRHDDLPRRRREHQRHAVRRHGREHRLPPADRHRRATSPAADPVVVGANQPFASLLGPGRSGRTLPGSRSTQASRTFGAAQATVGGTLHDHDPRQDFAEIVKTISITVTNPSITIDKTGSITRRAGAAERHLHVLVTNTQPDRRAEEPGRRPGRPCARTPTYASGDANGDGSC